MTGISGLLGTNLANTLLADGFNLKAIIRDPSKYQGLRTPNLELIRMDLGGDYEPHLKGIQTVVHLAAETATDLVNCQPYYEINTEATIRLFDISKKQGVNQFIFISTANTIGHGSRQELGREGQPMRKPFSQLCYAQSKRKAEEYLVNQMNGMEVKILNPTFMIGPHDIKPSSGKIIQLALGKKVVFYPPGGKNFVPVKDVVRAIINSFQHGTSGQKYLVAGANLTYAEFFSRLRAISRDKQVLIPAPKALLLLIGIFGDLIRALSIKTSISYVNMNILCVNNFYENEKSKADLQVQYTPLDEAIEEAVEYFRNDSL